MQNLIDADLVSEQFGSLDQEMAPLLCEALESDFKEWTQRLFAGWDARDEEQIRRARHSLKGLCGNFGADALYKLSEEDFSQPGHRRAMNECVELTIRAIKTVAAGD